MGNFFIVSYAGVHFSTNKNEFMQKFHQKKIGRLIFPANWCKFRAPFQLTKTAPLSLSLVLNGEMARTRDFSIGKLRSGAKGTRSILMWMTICGRRGFGDLVFWGFCQTYADLLRDISLSQRRARIRYGLLPLTLTFGAKRVHCEILGLRRGILRGSAQYFLGHWREREQRGAATRSSR